MVDSNDRLASLHSLMASSASFLRRVSARPRPQTPTSRAARTPTAAAATPGVVASAAGRARAAGFASALSSSLAANLSFSTRVMTSTGLRHRLLHFLERPNSSRGAFFCFCFLVAAIATSVVSFFLSTVEALEHSAQLQWLELVLTGIFSIEIGLRVVAGSLDVRRKLLLDGYFWIDVSVLAPSYLVLANLVDEANPSFRLMRLLRLLRTLKLMRFYSGWRVLTIAIHNSWRALLVPGFAMLIMTLLLSGTLFLVEETGEPSDDAFADGFDALWCVFWIVTTLGYDGPMGNGSWLGQLILAVTIGAARDDAQKLPVHHSVRAQCAVHRSSHTAWTVRARAAAGGHPRGAHLHHDADHDRGRGLPRGVGRQGDDRGGDARAGAARAARAHAVRRPALRLPRV